MAIYHLRVCPVYAAGTSIGRSAHHGGHTLRTRGASGKSAYLSGEKRIAHDGAVIDYASKREAIEHTQLVLPGGGTTDRESFWNSVDAHKVRKNTKHPTVARDMVVALPHELSFEARRDACEKMARWIADTYSVAVDFGMHKHTEAELLQGSDRRNFHCHFLMSERTVKPDGELGNVQRGFNPTCCKRSGRTTAVQEIRLRWQEIANDALEREGCVERIDCRSYKEQGVDKTPGQHRGREATSQLRSADKLRSAIKEYRDRQLAIVANAEKTLSEIAAREKVGGGAYISGRIGDIEAWQRDPLAQLLRSMAREDKATDIRKRLHGRASRQRPLSTEERTQIREQKRRRTAGNKAIERAEKAVAALDKFEGSLEMQDGEMTKGRLARISKLLNETGGQEKMP